jgi:hypothetical protein
MNIISIPHCDKEKHHLQEDLCKPRTLKAYLHAHISTKQANKSAKLKIQKKNKSKWGWNFNLWIFIFMFMSLAKNWHTSRMKLKCLKCQQLDHFHATGNWPIGGIGVMKICTLNCCLKLQRFLTINYISHLIHYPILHAIPKRKVSK